MSRLFAALGIDYAQWKALTLTALRLDFRTTALGRHGMRQPRNTAALILMQLVFYTFIGAAIGALAAFSSDLFLVGTVAMTYVVFIVGTAVLLDHNSVLTSPVDYGVLGFRPVSSRTYFASRLANAFVYTTAMTTIAAYIPIGVLFYEHGVVVGLAAVAAFYGCSASITLVLLLGYASVLRLAGPDAIKRILSYVQLLMSFFVYGGYLLVSRAASTRFLARLTIPKAWWMALYPGTWFASYLALAGGQGGVFEIALATTSIAVLALLAIGARGRLSLTYAERLGDMMTSGARTTSVGADRTTWLGGGETRAIALLIRAQWRNDQKFRLGVLSILPMTILYLLMGVHDDRGVRDPFLQGSGGNLALVTMAIMMFPPMLKIQIGRSDYFKASWIFFACPTDRMRILRATRNALVYFFLIPYLLIVSLMLGYLIDNYGHALVHVATLGVISCFALQLVFLMQPELPFAKPLQTSGRSGVFFVVIMVFGIGSSVLQSFAWRLYARPVATLGLWGIVALATVVADSWMRLRVEGRTSALEFEG